MYQRASISSGGGSDGKTAFVRYTYQTNGVKTFIYYDPEKSSSIQTASIGNVTDAFTLDLSFIKFYHPAGSAHTAGWVVTYKKDVLILNTQNLTTTTMVKKTAGTVDNVTTNFGYYPRTTTPYSNDVFMATI